MKGSLNQVFVAIWLFVVATSVALAFLMLGLSRLGVDARVDAVEARVDKAASALRTRFSVYEKSYAVAPDFGDAQRRRELELIVQLVLQDFDDVEGGFYASGTGFLAYAFPSYEGGSVKQDVPAAESSRIAALAQQAIDRDRGDVVRAAGARETLIIEAVPVAAGGRRLAIWVMARAHVRADDASDRLMAGLGILGLFVVGSGLFFALVLRRWQRAVTMFDDQLDRAAADPQMRLAATGQPDLDRVVGMVATLRDRLDVERRALLALENELSRARRIASLGRMTAQLVHEIRNPIAAMRLRTENALAGAGDRDAALAHILKDVKRLSDLLERMQAMTRLNVLQQRAVALDRWLDGCVAAVAERAAACDVTIAHDAPSDAWRFDPDQLARAVDNLLLNAIQHAARPDGRVRVQVGIEPGVRCRIAVADNGPGIPSTAEHHLFDPFFTTRADGTGLGLSIAREIVEAHDGTLSVVARGDGDAAEAGAQFIIELPWRAS